MALYDNPTNPGKITRVGDVVVSEWGESEITSITVCPTPTKDAAGEETGIDVEEVELAHVPAVLNLANGHWMYGIRCTARVATS